MLCCRRVLLHGLPPWIVLRLLHLLLHGLPPWIVLRLLRLLLHGLSPWIVLRLLRLLLHGLPPGIVLGLLRLLLHGLSPGIVLRLLHGLPPGRCAGDTGACRNAGRMYLCVGVIRCACSVQRCFALRTVLKLDRIKLSTFGAFYKRHSMSV